ncbi:4'-phosphopantetheinyl transferase family protein [Brevibacillus centrosporus]|uniref:Phosphopantetheine--protein transferase domain-containing protein n=1 Tax=Brevibacillus centrosporus TaxID=54910 RepID=A0A1I4E1N2_9BACL|nr:4'-phosphopantetheinyl transferase superfamily protein [Brevibacillus centrosporus]SFK99768.1 phosphopantetheine--protein transferase domain-containing protein [Brevibacillus centrosporus]
MAVETVEIYWLPFSELLSFDIRILIPFLNRLEQNTFHSFKAFSKQREFLLGRVLLKSIISAKLRVCPKQIQFKKNKFGKLLLDEELHPVNNISFNLSHSNSILACAVMNGNDIGVDVEEIQFRYLNLMSKVFTQEETEYVLSFNNDARAHAFFEIWTKKEAYVKAIGHGLSIPLKSFSVPFGSQRYVGNDWGYYTINVYNNSLLTVAFRIQNNVSYKYQVKRLNLTDFLTVMEEPTSK